MAQPLFTALLAMLLTALPLPAAAQLGTAADLDISAKAYILIDADTGAVLAQHNPDLRLPPASLTKIMSSHLHFQAVQNGTLTLQQTLRISRNASAQNTIGSKMFLEAGSDVTVADLLRGVIIQSGNDAVRALAEELTGSETAFAAAMNDTAAQIGMENSHFVNASGLTQDNHYSSARDIATLLQHLRQHFPALYPLFAEREFTHNGIRQERRDPLLSTYPGADGMKTGYTRAAGYCIAASATRRGRTLIAVLLGAPSEAARADDIIALLNHGYTRFHNLRLFSSSDTRFLPVQGGASASVQIRPVADGVYTLPRGTRAQLRFKAHAQPTAPIAAGDPIGELEVHINGALHDSVSVVAVSDVADGGLWQLAKDKIKVELLGHRENNAVLFEW